MTTPAHRLAATRMYLMEDDVDAIRSIIPPEGEPIVVDLGSGSGTTALAVLGANEQARVFSADISQTNLDWAEKNVTPHYPEARVEWNLRSAVYFARYWKASERDPVDVLLHDAGHTYHDVLNDLQLWVPLMKSGAPLWIHDYNPPPEAWGQVDESEGVRRAVAELERGRLIIGEPVAGLGWIGEAL